MEAGSSHDKRAPEPLGLVQRFVNSLDLDEGREELGTPEELSSWLVERGLMAAGEPVTDGDVRRAIEVREGLRSLLLAHNGAPRDDAAVARLDRASARAGLRAGFEPGQLPTLVPDATGVDGALGRLLAIVVTAAAEGTWERLKACPREDCQWAFYDHSKNRSARWCRMEECGNREKARAYRERHRHARGAAA